MSSAPSLRQIREGFEALGPPGTPFTTTEVATGFECTDRTVYNRLETFVEDSVLETKKVGARGRVWWRPVERDSENERNTEETYQKLFESINEGLCIIEVLFDADEQPVDYRFLETNPAFDELTRLGDAAGKRIRELDVDHNDNRVQKYGAVARTGEPVQFTEYAEHLGEQWYEINAFRVGDPTDHTVAVLFADVSKRKHAERTAQEDEKRLEALVKSTTEGVYRVSPDWSEIYQLAGNDFLPDDLPNTWQEYIPERDRERVGEAIEEAIETQSPFELEHRINRADGTVGWVDSRAVPIVEDGEIVEWVGTGTDITERKERESRIERYKLYLESAPDLVTVLDEDGVIRYDSPGVSRMLGYGTEERIGDSGFDYVHPDDRDRIRKRFNNRASGDLSRSKEYRARTKDGDWIWLESRTRIPGEDHTLDGNVVTARDITRRKEQQRKRQEVIDRVTDGIIELDANWQCQFVSGQGGALLSISESELLNRNFWDVFEDARGTVFETQYRAVMDTREPASFVGHYPTLDGWFDVQAYPSDDGGIAIYFREITKRKKQQKARQRAETRYRTLLEFAPDPIITVDSTTEEIRSANQAAGELLGCAPDELVGRQRATIHPAEKKEAYEALFKRSREERGRWRTLPDGSPNHVVTEDGEKVPVELSTRTVTFEDSEIVFKSFREISAQIEHQRRLATLNDIIHELFDGKDTRDIKRRAVQTAADLLDVSTVAFYSFDEDGWAFEPVASVISTAFGERIDDLPIFEPGTGAEWRAFTDERTAVINDLRAHEAEYAFDRALRSELIVPVADRGVLLVGDIRPDVIDEWMVSVIETLGATVEAALTGAEREQALREQRQELREVESLNQQIRDVSHEAVQADTRVELERAVCERLVGFDPIEFAWLGGIDLERNAVVPQAQAGVGDGYLEDVCFSLDGDGDSEPTVEAARSRKSCASANTATGLRDGDWQAMAIERGFRSVISIPVIYRDSVYGVLSVYGRRGSSFSDGLRSVLEDLCDLVAHATFAIEQAAVLQADRTLLIEFEVRDHTQPLCRLASLLGCEIELDSVISQPGESSLVFISVSDAASERAHRAIEQLGWVEDCQLFERADDTLVRLLMSRSVIRSVPSDMGYMIRELVADDARCRVAVEVPKATDTRRTVNQIISQHDDTQLLAKRELRSPAEPDERVPGRVLEALTQRQREVVETAYRCGYFSSPRRASGGDLAELFGFSNAAFHQHLRKAERTVFKELLEEIERSPGRSLDAGFG